MGDSMLKNYNFMLTILLYPFMLVLGYLKLSNVIRGELYDHLIIIMILLFVPSFIMSLYSASEEIFKSKKKWRIVLLVFLSIFYLPIYYTKYISKEEKYLGFILFIISIPLTILTLNACYKKVSLFFYEAYKNTIVINENYVYISQNRLFSLNVDASFRCSSGDIGDYVVACDRLDDDSFVGIYSYDVSYDSDEKLVEKLEYHVKQAILYIEENGYTYVINRDDKLVRIEYNNNIILISQNNYLVDDVKYSLIVMKEMPREYINYEEYQKMIDSISFLNYNERESS